VKQLVVISGKGGTGKTSLVASFAALARQVPLADCDVDAADLNLVLEPRLGPRRLFWGGRQAKIKPGHCTACGKCEELCRFDAIFFDGPANGVVAKTYQVDPVLCEGCGVCAWFCAEGAIEFAPAVSGERYVSDPLRDPGSCPARRRRGELRQTGRHRPDQRLKSRPGAGLGPRAH